MEKGTPYKIRYKMALKELGKTYTEVETLKLEIDKLNTNLHSALLQIKALNELTENQRDYYKSQLNKEMPKEDFEEELRIFKLGNEQVVKELKIIFKEKLKYLEVIEWVKEQYDSDFSVEEIDNLEPRDSAIYERISETIKNAYEAI